MNSIQRALIACLAGVFAASVHLLPAASQNSAESKFGAPPPEAPAMDKNGVALPPAMSIYSKEEVSIGPVESGLKFVKYINGRDRTANVWGELRVYPYDASGYQVALATMGNHSEWFVGSTLNMDIYASSRSLRGRGGALTGNASAPVYTQDDGTKVFYKARQIYDPCGCDSYIVDRVERPDGEVQTWNIKYINNEIMRIQSINSSLGYQIKFKYKQNYSTGGLFNLAFEFDIVYGINNAMEYCEPSADSCSLSMTWPTTSFNTALSPSRVETTTDAMGRQTRARWAGGGVYIRTAASSVENIQLGIEDWYDCLNDIDKIRSTSVVKNSLMSTYYHSSPGDPSACENKDRILTVTDLNGNTTNYKYQPSFSNPMYSHAAEPDLISEITNELGQKTKYEYDYSFRLKKIILPEFDSWSYEYDSRGNILSIKRYPKSGSGYLSESRTYPTTCVSVKTCNKPLTVTDGNNNTTTYTYDPAHGGVLTVTGPAVGPSAIRPQTRYTYAQFTAMYFRSGVLQAAAAPVWRLTQASTCQTLASCAGTADEIVTTYTYEPSNVANNVRLLATTTRAGDNSLSATTSYTYNNRGDVISIDGPLPGAVDTTRYYYDATRWKIGEIGPDPDGTGPLLHRASRITYNADGQVTLTETGTATSQSDGAMSSFSPRAFMRNTYGETGQIITVEEGAP